MCYSRLAINWFTTSSKESLLLPPVAALGSGQIIFKGVVEPHDVRLRVRAAVSPSSLEKWMDSLQGEKNMKTLSQLEHNMIKLIYMILNYYKWTLMNESMQHSNCQISIVSFTRRDYITSTSLSTTSSPKELTWSSCFMIAISAFLPSLCTPK